jgi:hypothetical protein
MQHIRIIVIGDMTNFYNRIRDVSTFSLNWHVPIADEDEKHERWRHWGIYRDIDDIEILEYSDRKFDITYQTIDENRPVFPEGWIRICSQNFPELSFKLYFYGQSFFGYFFGNRDDPDFYEIEEDEDPIFIAFHEKFFPQY